MLRTVKHKYAETYKNAENTQKGFDNCVKFKNKNQDKNGPLLET